MEVINRFLPVFLAVAQLFLHESGSTADDGCPELHPPRVVVRHGDPVSVNCTMSTDHSGMGWVAPVDDVPNTRDVKFLTWTVESLTIWDLRPQCYANRPGKPQCKERLSVTVYNPPDSVSVSSMVRMVEGSRYPLKCEIQNIAPVQNLTVKWYEGDTLVHEDRDYVIEDGKSDREKAPVNVSSTLLITPSRADDGAEYSCEAELDLGAEGPQPPISVKSTPLNITVHYEPTINPIDKPLLVLRGYSALLNCSAKGNPPPVIEWIFNGRRLPTQDGIYTITETDHQGNYTCRANNSVGIHEETVQVVFTENYIPLIAGILVVLVLGISLVFCVIYSIYYKNKKMGQYNLKSVKFCTQNGHVAQNGKDSSLPMTRLPEDKICV